MSENNSKKEKFKNNKEREAFLEDKYKEIQEEQEANLLLDFDAAIEEAKKESYKIRLGGKIFNVSKNMPLNFATFFFRYCYKKVNGVLSIDVPEERMYTFIQLMFGAEILRALERNSNISIDMVFEKFALKILEKWGYSIKENKANKTQKKI